MKIKKLKSNKHYRVNDLFFGWGMRWQQDRFEILNNPKYKDSILFEYLSKKEQELDYSLFKEILRRHTEEKKYKTPNYDELVIQLRLGDIMDSLDYNFAKKKSIYFYSDFFSHIDISGLSINKITAVTALHFGDNEINGKYSYSEKAVEDSFKIVKSLSEQCKKKGYDLNIYSHEDVDQDLCYLAHSKYFVKGITPLGDLIVKCLPWDSIIYEPFFYY